MSDYQVCTRCVMDTSAEDIVFDENGVCNYCTDFLVKLKAANEKITDELANHDEFIARVKANGKGKKYDCIVGVSGGVDSSYALYLAVKHGLRPLAVHLDNGWNTELASHNIANLIDRLGVDLYTHVIDWEENRDMQISFFKANVVDIELLTDNTMIAFNYQQAAKHGLRYILSGGNSATEGLTIPSKWNHFKYDARNIRNIQRRFGSIPIKPHLLISTLDIIWYEIVRGVHWISFLDYYPYNKIEALETLKSEVDYWPYPYKHYESVFTRFYQAYILPRKFGYDKRRVHLSTLVANGQMNREEAIQMLETPPYPDSVQEEQDRLFVMKELGFTEKSFQQYMQATGIPHEKYGSEIKLYQLLMKIYKFFRRD